MKPLHARRRKSARRVYLWHRYLGLSVALIVVMLVITGVLLNHTDGLRLDRHHVTSDAVLGWYGIEGPAVDQSYCPDTCVSRVGPQLFFGTTRLSRPTTRLGGAVRLPAFYVVAADDALLMLTPEGELVEQLGEAQGVPPGVEAIGVHDGAVVVKTRAGRFVADAELLAWSPHLSAAPPWSTPSPAPAALTAQLTQDVREGSLTYERVLLDVHSGRFFGRWGPWFIDAAALAMALLSLTGFRIWWRQRQRSRRRRRRPKGANETESQSAPQP